MRWIDESLIDELKKGGDICDYRFEATPILRRIDANNVVCKSFVDQAEIAGKDVQGILDDLVGTLFGQAGAPLISIRNRPLPVSEREGLEEDQRQ